MSASVFGGVHDFFHSRTWDATWRGAVGVLIVFWAAIVYWVWKDAHRRIRSKILVALVTLVGMIPSSVTSATRIFERIRRCASFQTQ